MLYEFNRDLPATPRLPVYTPASLGIVEKDIEIFFAAHLNELVLEDQLMLIGQERAYQEEADLLALDRKGTLYIFELKRWQSDASNLLQVMRYGQIFGRYDYEALQDLAQRQQKLVGELKIRHQQYFELKEALFEGEFNKDQVFVVVTNGVDRDTLEAIRYWSRKGIRVQSLTYRCYSVGGKPYFWFDVYNPEQDVLIEESTGIYVVNTNESYMPGVWKDMLSAGKASAYYGRKFAVAGITKGSTIYLYQTGVGVIAKGETNAPCRAVEIDGNKDEEFFVPVKFEWKVEDSANWPREAVAAWEINHELKTGYRFRQTAFSISEEMAEVIDRLWHRKFH